MKKNTKHRPLDKKVTTLKATAAAVLAINSGMASATSCPPYISIPITGVCTFDNGSSVTVANGGAVYSINMNNYQPSSSFITVDAGGVITGSAKGIQLTGASSLSGDISNSGSIHGTGMGISVENASTVNGSISNNGTIAAGNHGINVSGTSVVNGGISNSGVISAVTAAGISVATSTIHGGISNSGTINAMGNNAQGITVYSNSSLTGGISNSGTINATLNGQGIGVYSSSSIAGGISNSGTLNGFTGVRIDFGSSISGGISNSGSISADYVGIAAFHASTITGDIANSGEISATSGAASQFGMVVQSSSLLNGSLSNSGSINARTMGMGVYNATVSGNITNNGVINAGSGIGLQTNAHVNGGISNSGTITAGYTRWGISILTSTLTKDISNSGFISGLTGIGVSNNSTVGGISNSGIILGSAHSIYISGNSTVSNIDIIGKTARLIGDVLAAGTTLNITSGADFTSEGAFDVSRFNIASNAIFHMANTITAASAVDNAGTLSVANGTLQTIHGNYTQEATGVYQIGATNTGSYGQLNATGIMDLSASGAIDVQIEPGSTFHQGDVLLNVLSSNSFTVPTEGYLVTDNSFLWQFTATTNESNGVNLSIGIDPMANSACRGTYCESAASAIINQVAVGNASFNPYAALATATDFKTAASQATPELTNENLQVIQLVSRTVIDVLPMWSTLRGLSTGDAMIYQPGKIWLKPYGASMTQNQRNTVNGYTASAYGLVAGRDIAIDNHWMLGGALAAGGDNMRGKSVLNGQSIDSAQYQALLYASKSFIHNAYFAAQGLLGYGNNDSKRVLPLFASTATGSYNSWFTDLSAELGWSHALTDRLVFIPVVNASYLFINQNGYTEKGSVMDLRVRTNNNNSLVLGADANLAYRATTLKNQQDITVTGHAGVAYDAINNQPSTLSSFVAGGPSFSTYGIQYNGAVFRGGVGLTLANPTKPLSVNLNADLQTGNNGSSGIYSATLKYKM